MILGAGCTDTGGANPETTTYTPPPQESPVVEETTEPTPDENDNSIYCSIFSAYINGTKSEVDSNGNYNVVDENNQVIFQHSETTYNTKQYTNILRQVQLNKIREEYGEYGFIEIPIFEKIDLDGDGKFDKVGLKIRAQHNNYKRDVSFFVHEYVDNCDIFDYLSIYIAEEFGVHWWDGSDDFHETTVSTMFDIDVHGIKSSHDDWFSVFNIYSREQIFHRSVYTPGNPTNFKLYNELPPDQYKALVSEYGSMRHLTMETIDLDQDGAMDKVAVKYVGSDGVLEFETNPMRRADGSLANVGVQSYLGEYLYEN